MNRALSTPGSLSLSLMPLAVLFYFVFCSVMHRAPSEHNQTDLQLLPAAISVSFTTLPSLCAKCRGGLCVLNSQTKTLWWPIFA